MIARRGLLVGAWIGISLIVLIALATVGARAAEPSAKAFVEAIYANYKGKNAKGVALASDAAVKRYFEPKLAALIIKDRNKAAKRGEVGTLDSDPFIDAQDFEIDTVDVVVRDTAADKASAIASFKNLNEPTTVVLDLVKLREGWRIADIAWDRKETLRGMLTRK
jgi:hypothetical protein